MSCNEIAIEDINKEFLEMLTRINAEDVFDDLKNPDHVYNWIEGKRLTAYTIIDCFINHCKTKQECKALPKCCIEYLDEINIDLVKEYKAYFIWESKGRNPHSSPEQKREHYFNACNEIMAFCDKSQHKGKRCTLNRIVCTIDRRSHTERRKVEERRSGQISTDIEKRSGRDRRSGAERRVHDHRGKAAKHLPPCADTAPPIIAPADRRR